MCLISTTYLILVSIFIIGLIKLNFTTLSCNKSWKQFLHYMAGNCSTYYLLFFLFCLYNQKIDTEHNTSTVIKTMIDTTSGTTITTREGEELVIS